MINRRMRLLTASIVLALGAAPAFAGPRRNLPGFSTNVLSVGDDVSSGLVPIGFTINLSGTSYSSLYVNDNGNVTFDGPVFVYAAVPLTSTTTRILAPFWADVDTRGDGSGRVHYGTGTVDGHLAFGVEWPGVGYFSGHADKLNTFELVIIDRSDLGAGSFDLEYNYDSIQWETGSGNGGVNGLGGNSARAGYSNGLSGSANVSFELPGSGVSGAFLDGGPQALVQHSLNTAVVGRYLFWMRNGNITNVTDLPGPGTTPAGAPAATGPVLILTGILLIGMVWFLRLRAA